MNFKDRYSSEDVFPNDFILAEQLQKQFDKENKPANHLMDTIVARNLQDQFRQEEAIENPKGDLVYKKEMKKQGSRSLVDPSWELVDPTPDIYILFAAFNTKFFWGKLDAVCVSWSKRMKRCAGICSYQGRGGLCHITLSEPLLKLRPRKDLIETLLHEMIHALLFVTHNNRDRDGHGPEFHKHMYRINKEAGTNITVYHDFHDEVELYLQHWWRCNGPCQKWKPYFGIVRRSMNRAPGPNDRWWGEHSRTCGGTYTKIKSPEKKGKEQKEKRIEKSNNDIRKYLPGTLKETSLVSTISPKHNEKTNIPKRMNSNNINTLEKSESTTNSTSNISKNIHGFSNLKNWSKGATRNNSNVIVITKKNTVISENNERGKEQPHIVSNIQIERNKSSDESKNSKDSNYEVVRQHWLNKFSNKDSPDAVKKRKTSSNSVLHTKTPKMENASPNISSNVLCPVCSKSYPMTDLNVHLDNCLTSGDFEIVKHSSNFDEKDDSLNDSSVMIIEDDDLDFIDNVNCSKCKCKIPIDDLDDHLRNCGKERECPECEKKIREDVFDVHLSDCLLKKLNEIDKLYNTPKKKDDDDGLIDCLACGKKVSKSLLSVHLDECLNEVFNDKEKCQDYETCDDEKLYNCPICMKLYSELEMNNHVDECLVKVSDNSL